MVLLSQLSVRLSCPDAAWASSLKKSSELMPGKAAHIPREQTAS